MAITTSSILAAPVQQHFSRLLLAVPYPSLIHNLFAMKKEMPPRAGRTLRMRRYNKLGLATVPLGNSGITPPPQSLTAVDIDATIEFYGTYVQINQQVTLQNEDPKMNGVVKPLLIDLEAEVAIC